MAKGLKLKVRKIWGLIPTFAEVKEENLVGGGGFLPPPPILNRVKRVFPTKDNTYITSDKSSNGPCLKILVHSLFIGTVMQIEKELMDDRLRVSKVFRIPTIYNFGVIYWWNFAIFLKGSLLFNSFYCLFCLFLT